MLIKRSGLVLINCLKIHKLDHTAMILKQPIAKHLFTTRNKLFHTARVVRHRDELLVLVIAAVTHKFGNGNNILAPILTVMDRGGSLQRGCGGKLAKCTGKFYSKHLLDAQ